MSITSDMIRGHTETIILANLIKKDSYGYEINKAVKVATGNEYELKEATLYTAFRRLEEQGCIISYWGDDALTARRKYYSITAKGKAAYAASAAEWQNVKLLIDKLITIGQEEG